MTYEYQCLNEKCKQNEVRKEIIHGMSESPTVFCDVCGGKMARAYSSPTIKTGDGRKSGENK